MSNIILPSNDIEIANPSGNLLPSQFNASFLGNLKPILEDVLAGDPKAATRPEFTCLNLSAVQKALDWLQNNDMLSKTAKADLIMNPWRLNYKDRPPTPEEFLTKKFIGPQAEGMYEHNRKAFIEFMDPLKPYDCLILYSCIGSGKSTLTMLVFLYLATLFAYMRAPFRYFGHQPSTQYVFALCSMTMKKASELYMEPIRNIIENADFWQKCRTKYDMIAEEKKFEEQGTVDHINWTTASPTSPLATSNGLNWKIISSEGGLIGQSQPLDEPIKMADGTWKNMGDIEIGDKVMSSKGTPTYVMAILPQGKIPCYTITLDDGRSVRCSANHKWKVAWEKLPNGDWDWQIVNTQFMIDHPDLDFEIWDYYNQECLAK